MKRLVRQLNNHSIVCGAGRTGIHIIEELASTNREFVVIERNPEVVARVEKRFPKVAVICGDVDEDSVLFEAGIDKATGLAASLSSDKDNLFLIVSVHKLNPNCRIVSKITEPANKGKFLAAGASSVVSPTLIGGQRISAELVRPNVVAYLEDMQGDRRNVRVEEVRIPEDSWVIGKPLADLQISKRLGVQIIAVRELNKPEIDYSPNGDHVCSAGSVLIITATPDKVAALAQFVSEKRTGIRA